MTGAQARIEEDLRWLGLFWDEGPILQSDRGALYGAAIAQLDARGLVYPCDCSRAEIARVASAPHAGEDVIYPGFCRDRDPSRAMRRPPALRARVTGDMVEYEDGAAGLVAQNLARDAGDFVLSRGDGVFAYQLAVVVDDVATEITDVVRGADLIASTPRQIWLARELGAQPPRYTHIPMVVGRDGARLEKRTRGALVRDLREAGVLPQRVIGVLACALGLVQAGSPMTAIEVAKSCAGRPIVWAREPWPIPESW